MKVLILDRIIKELKEKTILFGIQEKETVIISSLKNKPGLEKVGVFSTNKSEDESLILSFKNDKLECNLKEAEIETINYTTDFNKRNHGVIDESVLQNKTITIIGLGSGGSAIALDLIRCGVTNLVLIDFDSVSISNLCRSVYDLPDIAKKKTAALQEKAFKINPCINLELFNEDILAMEFDALTKIINKSDLIIEATDSIKTKVMINGLAYQTTPVVYPAVYDHGRGGDILFTKPGLPCYECVFKSIINDMKDLKKGDWDYSTGQAKPMPALISDIQIIVARTVKLALAILSDDKDSFLNKITEPGCTILFVGNEKNTFVFEKPFQEVWAETEIDPDCSCQALM